MIDYSTMSDGQLEAELRVVNDQRDELKFIAREIAAELDVRAAQKRVADRLKGMDDTERELLRRAIAAEE